VPRVRILVAAVLVVSGPTGGTAGAQSEGGHRPDLTVATYNIHAGAGEDNVFDLDRTAAALRAMRADVIGLQEVDVHWGARSDFVDENASPMAPELAPLWTGLVDVVAKTPNSGRLTYPRSHRPPATTTLSFRPTSASPTRSYPTSRSTAPRRPTIAPSSPASPQEVMMRSRSLVTEPYCSAESLPP